MRDFFINRLKGIIFYPEYEWKIINAESRSLREDFSSFALNLILIGAISQLIGSFFFVRNVLDIDAYKFSFPLLTSLFYIIKQAITIIILTFFVNGVAAKFKSSKDFVKSGKLVIYSLAPFLVAYAISNINRHLILVMIFGLYSLLLFSKGLPILIKTPKHKLPAFLFIFFIGTLGINYILETGFTLLISVIFPDILMK